MGKKAGKIAELGVGPGSEDGMNIDGEDFSMGISGS